MKELSLLYTKNVHFTFNKGIYQESDSVAMGSPLGLVIVGIYMVELEKSLIPTLMERIYKRYS